MIGHDAARQLLSRRRDEPIEASDAIDLDQHLAGCARCSGFERRLDEIGHALREPLDAAPDVRARVLAAVTAGAGAGQGAHDAPPAVRSMVASTAVRSGRGPDGAEPGAGGRSGDGDGRAASVVAGRSRRAWRWLPAAACLVAGLLIGSALVGGLREPPVPAAAQVPEQVAAAEFGITSLSADLQIVERGWNAAVPSRTFAGTLDYETPGSLALHLDDTTRYPSPAWIANDVDLVAHDGTWWARGPRDCSSLGQPSCTAPEPRLEVVDAIAPFDDGAPVPLDLVVPVRSFLHSVEPASLGTTTISGRDAVGVRVTAVQVGPLLDGLRPAGNLRQFYPADVVDLWLDATSWTPLRFAVSAADEPDRLTWARNRGYVEDPGDEILTATVDDLRVNAGIDASPLEPAPPGGVRRDAGFTPVAHDATSPLWVGVDPATVPAGLAGATTGIVGAGTVHETSVRTWVGGRGWVKVAATRGWDGDRLFGDLGSPVRRLDGDDGTVYVSLDGTRVAVHGAGIDVVITGSVDEQSLVAVARGLGARGTVVPATWSDAATETRESAAEILPGLLVPAAASGYEAAAVRADGSVITQAFAGSDGRGFVMVEAPGNRLSPPLDMDIGGVVVRGVDGRFSAARGELEWVESERIHRLTSTTLTRAELLAVAAGVDPGMTGRSGSRRAMGLVALVVVGMLVGSVATLVVQDRRASDPDRAAGQAAPGAAALGGIEPEEATPTTIVRPPPASPVPASSPGDPTAGPPTEQVLLAWMIQALPPDLLGTVRALPGIDRVTGVRHGTVGLVGTGDRSGTIVPATAAGAGFAVPIDAIAVDPLDYPSFAATDVATTFLRLGPDDAVLSRTGAQLRGVGPGAVLRFAVVDPAGATVVPVDLTVAAVVDDAVVGGAELAVGSAAGDRLGLGGDRYLLIAHQGDRALIEEAIRAALDAPVRFRGPGETPFLRDGDAVLPQAQVKASFGEFAVRRGQPVEQDPAWREEHLVQVEVPVLGEVRCHRAIVEDLRAAMDQIERENLAYLIDSSLACWYADTIEPTGAVSRGLWGLAVVLEPAMNPTGSRSVQDPRVVAIMQAHGFTWGGDFLVAEPAYFEHIGPPVPATP